MNENKPGFNGKINQLMVTRASELSERSLEVGGQQCNQKKVNTRPQLLASSSNFALHGFYF